MKRFVALFIALILTAQSISATDIADDAKLKKMIGRMLIIGFEGESIDRNSKITKEIQKYDLGGVILFDRYYNDKKRTKNISSPKQLKALTSSIRSFSKEPLLISVDQEGGRVARLKPAYGFEATPSAKVVSSMDAYMSGRVYDNLARTLERAGINCDFAPVVDLALNPKNEVIVKLKRSYSSDPKEVVKYAQILMDSLAKKQIVSVLKHFPGHGSSLGDSHKGFVDITKTWSEEELYPYIELIKKDKAKMIMSAHVFNSKLDDTYPATLSYKVNTKLLREKLGFKGVIVSDDLQMGAISEHYTLKQVVTLAINSGVDMLLFANQLSTQDTDELVETIFAQVKNGAISYERIKESNERAALLLKAKKIK